jgi:hypothetical protein
VVLDESALPPLQPFRYGMPQIHGQGRAPLRYSGSNMHA